MPPIGAAIGGLLGIGGGIFAGGALTIGGVATALIKVAAGFGLSYAARALIGEPETDAEATGVQAEIAAGDSQARSIMVGKWATAGSAIFLRAWGEDGKTPHAYLVQVIRISDLPINAVPDIYVDGSKCTYNPSTGSTDRGTPIPEYRKDGKDYLWVKIYKGNLATQATAADPYLMSKFGVGTRDWTSAHKGQGIAYAIVTSRYNEKLFSGRPEVLFVVEGIKLYDITKDSSAGGSGTQRYGNEATYTYTDNPMVVVYNLMRGITYGGKWIYGLQTVTPAQLPYSSWAAAIQECNLIITNRDGTTDPQYRCGAEIFCDTEVGAEISEFLKTCNGRIADCGGIYKPKVGPDVSSGASVFSFTDDSLMLSDEHEFSMFPSLDETINGIDATFVAPGDGWQQKALPPRRNAGYIDADEDRENIADINYAHVHHKGQAQRLSKAILAESRRFRKHVLVLPPEAYILEPLDFVRWTSTRNGYASKLFRVESVADRPNGDQVVGIQEVDPSDYDWSATEEVIIPDGTLIVDRPPAQAVASFTAAGITISGQDGRALPGIRVYWSGPDLDDVDRVKFQVRKNGTTALVAQPDMTFPEYGLYDITQGIIAKTAYEVRAVFEDFSRHRDFTWSAWKDVTTPDVKIIDDQITTSLINLINAGSAAGKVLTQQVLPAPAGFQTLYRITVYGTTTAVASGLYVYVSSTGVPGVIVDASTFAVGPLSSVPANFANKNKVFPFIVDSGGTVRLKRSNIQILQADQIDAGAITADKIRVDTITADRIKGGELSERYSNGGATSARITINQRGAVVLFGQFSMKLDKNTECQVGICQGSSNTPIYGGMVKFKMGDDIKTSVFQVTAMANIIKSEIGTSKAVFVLKELTSGKHASDFKLQAIRFAP